MYLHPHLAHLPLSWRLHKRSISPFFYFNILFNGLHWLFHHWPLHIEIWHSSYMSLLGALTAVPLHLITPIHHRYPLQEPFFSFTILVAYHSPIVPWTIFSPTSSPTLSISPILLIHLRKMSQIIGIVNLSSTIMPMLKPHTVDQCLPVSSSPFINKKVMGESALSN